MALADMPLVRPDTIRALAAALQAGAWIAAPRHAGKRGNPVGFAAGLGARLAAAGLAVTIDPATHLPLRLEGIDRAGRKQAAVCRWP